MGEQPASEQPDTDGEGKEADVKVQMRSREGVAVFHIAACVIAFRRL